MSLKVGLNGFGRIGRSVLRAAVEEARQDIEFVAINDLGDVETNCHLLNFDSVHGRLRPEAHVQDGNLVVGSHNIRLSAERDPAKIDWRGVDVVMECTGLFTSRDKAALHLHDDVKKVLISAPGKEADITSVYGVNHDLITDDHKIISNASCTTNCLAPVAKVLHDAIGIKTGYMTTVHAYTGDQCLQDGLHKDLRRARAAALSMVPTATGAARAVGLVLPELLGKIDGSAIRVPTANVSVIDLKFVPNRDTSIDEVNDLLSKAASGPMKGILAVSDKPLVSIDFNHDSHSSTVALDQTAVTEDGLVRVMSWYDNEWGFSNRMLDMAAHMAHSG
ncbi:MAG: type I glyceraldehyde-3-phosphate dehydrogenase [Candidatus Puniceispirillaceae bacterium]